MSGCLTLLLVLGVPAVDLWLLFRAGERLGGWTTLALVLAAAFIGLALVRRQRVAALASVPGQLAAGRLPSAALADAPMLALAGMLFVLPGFLTDGLGLLLLLPPVRRILFVVLVRRVLSAARQGRVQVRVFGTTVHGPAAADDALRAPGGVPRGHIKELPPDSYTVRDDREPE